MLKECELAPYGNQVICLVRKENNGGYQNGLYLPDMKKEENATFHEVVAIGPKVDPELVSLGDLVVLKEKDIVSLRYKGEIYLVADASNIMLVMTKEN